ncbi:MAG: DNA polymerase III subunit gamma/tau [Pseudomonadales bacterium]|nr:DNA polymerase III subunit gamma/tau [Pseudomonadales bacterium]
MSYLVLARKYRPRTFADVVGQEHVVRTLSNALESQRLHHAYLFTGTRGVGKTTLARILAACFNCETGITSTPCGECEACTSISTGRFLDLMEVDAASRTGVDDTRDLLANADLAPAQGRLKVYLIDEVHMLTGHSFNALLKTLEEPPEHVKFLLATTEAKKIPVTVLSRCLQFNLKNMLPDVIEAQLAKILAAEDIAAESTALAVIAQAANGSMRDALSITDQAVSHGGGTIHTESVNGMLGIAGRDEIGALLDALAAGDSERLLATGDELASRSLDLPSVLDELQRAFHDLAVAEQLNSEPGPGFARFRGKFSAEDLQLHYQIALMGRRDIEFAPDPKIGFDMTLLRLASFEPAGDAAGPDDITGSESVVDEHIPGTDARQPEPPEESVRATAPVVDVGADDVVRAEPVHEATDNWWEIVAAMVPAGVTAMILKNSNLTDRSAERWVIRLDQSHESLLNDKQRQEIECLASSYAGSELRVDFTIGKLERETPMARESRIAKEAREKAEATLLEDPNVQAMISEFGGTLDSARLSDVDGEAGQSPQ